MLCYCILYSRQPTTNIYIHTNAILDHLAVRLRVELAVGQKMARQTDRRG